MPDGTDNPGHCVALFGSCGGSKWRDIYREWCDKEGTLWFDPQITPETHGREWSDTDIKNEVRHLELDPILVFKVTGETTGLMSCLEVVKAIQSPKQFIIVQIEDLNADYREFSLDDPRMLELRRLLEEQGMKVDNLVRDAVRAREWAIKAVLKRSSPLVCFVDSDAKAIELISSAIKWLSIAKF